MDAEESRVRVRMVVRCRTVQPVIPKEKIRGVLRTICLASTTFQFSFFSPIKNISIKTCVHSFPRASGTETTTSSHHHVKNAHRDEVWILM